MNPVLYKPLRNAQTLFEMKANESLQIALHLLRETFLLGLLSKSLRVRFVRMARNLNFCNRNVLCFHFVNSPRNPAFCIYEMNKTIILIIFCSFWLLECKYWLWIVYLMRKKTSCLTWDCDKCSQIKFISLLLWTDFTFFLQELKSSLIFLQLLSHYVTF